MQREFRFTREDFDYIRGLVKSKSGIELSDAKYNMVYSRLSKRLRTLSLQDFSSYCRLLRSDAQSEMSNLINAITTNLTYFFREQHHFDFVINTLVPRWLENGDGNRRIRIWSAGCSTGEEAYSLAMCILDNYPQLRSWDFRILATDLDTDVLERARSGIYEHTRVTGIPDNLLKNWFLRRGNGEGTEIRVKPELQKIISFRQLNLLNEWPFSGQFDLIMCRNVMIYFNKDTQRQLVDRFADCLCSDGYFFLGHAESLFKVSDRFRLEKNTMYRKIR